MLHWPAWKSSPVGKCHYFVVFCILSPNLAFKCLHHPRFLHKREVGSKNVFYSQRYRWRQFYIISITLLYIAYYSSESYIVCNTQKNFMHKYYSTTQFVSEYQKCNPSLNSLCLCLRSYFLTILIVKCSSILNFKEEDMWA